MSLQVENLQEQLQKEKNFRETLEAGLKFLPGTLSELFDIDEQVSLSHSYIVHNLFSLCSKIVICPLSTDQDRF